MESTMVAGALRDFWRVAFGRLGMGRLQTHVSLEQMDLTLVENIYTAKHNIYQTWFAYIHKCSQTPNVAFAHVPSLPAAFW